MFEAINYTVISIDGDYAHLQKTENPTDDLKLVARALLPDSIREGSLLKYEMLQYTLIN
ncbi:MAG: chorismate--pyruvate lyase [Lachnospiraceae bacterium]|nr:chorismate--pyruvate lyase [Lachnospiraceae bacterium]